MEQTEELWLATFTRGRVRAQALEEPGGEKNKTQVLLGKDDELCRKRRAAEISKSVAIVNQVKQSVIEGLDMKFEVDGKKTKTKDAKGDATKVFDSDEARRITSDQDVKGDYSKAYLKAMNNFKPVADESQRLRELTIKRYVLDEDTGEAEAVPRVVALFEDADIMRDFYTPLVRELVIPENFVPDKYSATKAMLDGSTDAYIDECREKGKEPGRGLKDFSKGVVSSAATAVAGGFGTSSDTGQLIEGAALAIGAGIDGIDAAKKGIERGKFDIDSWEDVGDTLASAVGQIAGANMDSANKGDSYGQMVSIGVRAFGFTARMGKWANERRKNPKAEFPWGDLVAEVVKAGGSFATSQADTNSDTAMSDKQGITGAAVSGFGAALQSGVGQLKGLSLDSPPKDWAKAMTKVFATAAAESAKATVNAETNIQENADTNITNEQMNAENRQASKINTGIDSARGKADGGIDAAADKLFGKDESPEERKKKKQEEDQQRLSDAGDLIKAEKADYQNSLDRLGMMADEQTDDDFKAIAKLITKMENDRKIIQMAAAITTGGAEVAAHFFAPLKATGALVNFVVNTQAACERAMALMDWMDSHQDAMTAVSPYATAIQNFVKNQGDQLAHHSVQAALNAVEAACAIAECGFPPVKAATAAATAAVMLEKTIYEFVQKAQLRKAWKTTKEAMENPGNRKLGLIARKMNPTLAKYTIAYGAVVEKSPIAIAAMSRCGLDRETLATRTAISGR